MQLFIESTNLKQRGIISLFKTNKFKLTIQTSIEDPPLIDSLLLKAKMAYIGLIKKLPQASKLFITVESENEKKTFNIDISEGKKEVKINFSKFRGTINFNIMQDCLFKILENEQLMKKGLPPVDFFTTANGFVNVNVYKRKIYDNKFYFADQSTFRTYWQEVESECHEPIPLGWERRFTELNKMYYINHNKKIIQWENPNSTKYIIELDNKILQYKLLSDEYNFFGFFDFSKLKIGAKRKFLVQSTANLFLRSKKEVLRRKPYVFFYGEIGEDYGGIVKEFFDDCSLEITKDPRIKCLGNVYDICASEEISQDILEKFNKLCIVDSQPVIQSNAGTVDTNMIEAILGGENVRISADEENLNLYNPNDAFYEPENIETNKLCDKDFFIYLGIFIGLAFENEFNLAIDFSLASYENLLNKEFSMNLIQDLDFQKNLNYILITNMDNEILEDENGELITEKNKIEYVERTLKFFLYENKKQQYKWIREGFYKIIVNNASKIFNANDLSRLLSGKEDLTLEILKNSAVYLNCNEFNQEIIFLWNIFARKDESFYRKFLHFLTGSTSIPISAMRGNKFKWCIEIVKDEQTLFRASSCLNKLFVGKYQNEQEMERLLIFSMENTEGFHKV